jgi:hypothetical protein
LPLYPEEKNVKFNFKFFEESDNVLTRFLEEYAHIQDIIKVINIREMKSGKILKILMNSDEEKAIAYFTEGNAKQGTVTNSIPNVNITESQNWRMRMAEAYSHSVNLSKYNIGGIYLAGSVFEQTAMPDSDIDLIVIMNDNNLHEDEFVLWSEGWNSSLSSINYNRTGYKVEKLLDIKIINDLEIESNKFYRDILNPALHKSKKLI